MARRHTTTDFKVGARVALHPATDEWVQGDRFGEVVGFGRRREYVNTVTGEHSFTRPVRVKLAKSGRVRRFHPDHVSPIEADSSTTRWSD